MKELEKRKPELMFSNFSVWKQESSSRKLERSRNLKIVTPLISATFALVI